MQTKRKPQRGVLRELEKSLLLYLLERITKENTEQRERGKKTTTTMLKRHYCLFASVGTMVPEAEIYQQITNSLLAGVE